MLLNNVIRWLEGKVLLRLANNVMKLKKQFDRANDVLIKVQETEEKNHNKDVVKINNKVKSLGEKKIKKVEDWELRNKDINEKRTEILNMKNNIFGGK